MSQKIVYIGNFKFPDKNAAGKRVLGNCLLLKDLGYTPICIGSGSDESTEYEGIVCSSVKISNVARVLGSGTEKIIGLLNSHKSELFAVILYGSIFTQRENKKIVSWCKKNNIKVYYDQVDWFELNWHNPLRAIVRWYNHFLMNNRVIPKCDGVICISSFLANYHGEKGMKTVIIPPLSSSETSRDLAKPHFDTVNFVYAGTTTDVARPLSEWKDRIDIMFEALLEAKEKNDIRPFRFDIFGLTKEQYLRMFPEVHRKRGEQVLDNLGDNVIFHGLVPNSVAMAGVNSADFTVLIREKKRSTMSGFPTKVSESLSCGTPVICTDTSDLKKYIINGQNGYVCEIDELSKVYETVLKLTDEQLLKLRENCFDNVFYYKCFTDKMKAFLEEK